jgi:hypothetical protein
MIDPQLSDDAPVFASSGTLRQFAALWILVFGALAWRVHSHGAEWLAITFAALALVIGPLGLLKPAAIRPVFAGMMLVTLPIGWVVSHLILAVLYYGVFTPVGLVFKLAGRDVLRRSHRPDRPTYWSPKPMPTEPSSYFHEY